MGQYSFHCIILRMLQVYNCIAKEDMWTMWMSAAALTAAVCGAEQHSRSNEIAAFFPNWSLKGSMEWMAGTRPSAN